MKCATFGDNLVISFSDIWRTLKSAKYKIIAFSLICGIVFGLTALRQSVSYTAKATFRGQAQISGSKLLESLSGSRSNFTPTEPKTLLNSRSCVEFAVKKLHLQGNLRENKKQSSSLNRIWRVIKAEYLIHKYKNKVRPSSQVLSENVIVADQLLFKDEQPNIECKNIFYPDELFTVLHIDVDENDNFKVFHKKSLVGEGLLGTPFYWKKGCFTLQKAGLSRKTSYTLTLLPLGAAANGIIGNLKITRGKDNSSVIKLKYVHENRKLATNILNALMLALEEYIRAENHKKSSRQLEYLEVHHSHTTEKLEKMMEVHAKNLQENLSAGELVTLQKEIEFITQSQGEYRQQIFKLALDIQQIYSALNPLTHSKIEIEQIIEQFENSEPQLSLEFDSLNLETAKEIQLNYYQELERIELEMKQYDYHIKELQSGQNEITSLTKTLHDKVSLDLINKAHFAQLQLLDEKNRSLKEQERLKADLNLQRGFLRQHLEQLKNILTLEHEMIHKKLNLINIALLKLNIRMYELVQNQLKMIAEKTAKLPEKWLAEQKIELNKAIRMKVVETISSLIENRSIAHILENIETTPLDIAIFPVIPNSPGIVNKMFKGTLLGSGGLIFLLILYTIMMGPKGSHSNILGLGFHSIGSLSFNSGREWGDLQPQEQNILKGLAHKFASKEFGRVVLFQGKPNCGLATLVSSILRHSERRCIIVQMTPSNDSSSLSTLSYQDNLPFIKYPDYDLLLLPIQSQFSEAILSSESFKNIINRLKKCDALIFIQNFSAPESLETEILLSYVNDFVALLNSNEKLDRYRLFLNKNESAPKGIFVIEEAHFPHEWDETIDFLKEKKQFLYLHLRQLEPHLEQLIRKISHYASSKKIVLKNLPPFIKEKKKKL